MKTCFLPLCALSLLVFTSSRHSEAQAAPPGPDSSQKSLDVKDLNTPREFPQIGSRQDWEQRAREIRTQILVSCGLWPLPPKTPLQARVFGKVERDGYSVEKVYFQTYPGFYLAGNLYRPLGKGPGPFPAILNPHGHWKDGRLADTPEGSIPARCISFARQGMIAFSYDMAGFNDTHFAGLPTDRPYYEVHRQFATNRSDLLWNISPMGLQTWNSIRALDFLESLPDADRTRLACTGESGGGTQTFMLGAIDDRLAAQAPVVMVSHTMQGGCSCENAPGLRVEYSNMEIAAAAAPRPQMLVAASGDWTKDTLTVEGPALRHIYDLFQAPDRFHCVRFDFGHNYNQTSREAVYQWFGQWLLHAPNPASLKENHCQKEPDAELRVFPDNQLPAGALTQEQFTQSLKELHRQQWASLIPRDAAGLAHFRQQLLPAWQHTLQVDWPHLQPQVQAAGLNESGKFTTASLQISRPGESGSISATYWAPSKILSAKAPKLVILSSAGRSTATQPAKQEPAALTRALLEHGLAVLTVEHFSSPEPANQFTNFFTTYNRTWLQERVRDLLTLCTVAGSVDPRKPLPFRVILSGSGPAGLWSLLAAPAADAVMADCAELDSGSESALLAANLFCPGLLNIGGFEGAALLAAPHPLLLHHTGTRFWTKTVDATYAAIDARNQLRVSPRPLSDKELVKWAAQVRL